MEKSRRTSAHFGPDRDLSNRYVHLLVAIAGLEHLHSEHWKCTMAFRLFSCILW
jgi:hypothetical protein